MYKIKRLAVLKSMLFSMECSIGLDTMSDGQRDVYYAAWLTANGQPTVLSEDVRNQPMLRKVPRSTFFRLLKELVTTGYMIPTGTIRSGEYMIVEKP